MSSIKILVKIPTALFLLSYHPILLYIIPINNSILKFLVRFSPPIPNTIFYKNALNPIPMHNKIKNLS